MRFLKNVSIQRKLLVIIMLATSVALILACVGFVLYDLSLLKQALVEETTTLARLVGKMNVTSIPFDDPKTANDTLQALQANPHVVSAAVFTAQKEMPFAQYVRADAQGRYTIPKPRPYGHEFVADTLEVFQPIISENDVLGSVYIRSDLGQLHDALQKYVAIGVLMLVASSAAAFLISTQLQKVISRPILELAGTTELVARKNDYSIRAEKITNDEVGQLIDGFNEMLRQLQIRDAELQKAHDELEKRVEDRTRELQLEIVERKRAEEALRAFTRKLEQSNRELQDFAYVASHDLQEPLRKVQAFGDRLKTKYAPQLGNEGADFLDRMQNAARRMQALINDLLAFSRVTTKASPFQRVDLNHVLREVLSDLEVRLQQCKGRIETERLPAIEADPLQMRQLLQNLLSNALKFHKPESPPVVRVSAMLVEVTEEGSPGVTVQQCQLMVEDNGIGFEEKYLDRIFTVFQRLHGRGTYEGTGIGLAICRKIVDRHGGTITARSAPGGGRKIYRDASGGTIEILNERTR